MDTRQKGQLAVLKFEQEALLRGYVLSRPTMDARYDLILDDGKKLHRVQIKYGDGLSSHSSGCVTVELRRYNGNAGKNPRVYFDSEIDAVAVYIPKIERICWIPPEKFHGKTGLTIRLDPTKNGQAQNLIEAKDYFW